MRQIITSKYHFWGWQTDMTNKIFCCVTIADTEMKWSTAIKLGSYHIFPMKVTNVYLLHSIHCCQHFLFHMEHDWKEASKATILLIEQWGIKHNQIFPYPQIHQLIICSSKWHSANATERTTHIFKKLFIIGLCSTDPNFLVQILDHFLPQAEDSINMLHIACNNPSKSAYSHMEHIYNNQPWAPPGCISFLHEHPQPNIKFENIFLDTGYIIAKGTNWYQLFHFYGGICSMLKEAKLSICKGYWLKLKIQLHNLGIGLSNPPTILKHVWNFVEIMKSMLLPSFWKISKPASASILTKPTTLVMDKCTMHVHEIVCRKLFQNAQKNRDSETKIFHFLFVSTILLVMYKTVKYKTQECAPCVQFVMDKNGSWHPILVKYNHDFQS